MMDSIQEQMTSMLSQIVIFAPLRPYSSSHFLLLTIPGSQVVTRVSSDEPHCKGGSATAPFVLAVSPLKLSFSGIFVSKFSFCAQGLFFYIFLVTRTKIQQGAGLFLPKIDVFLPVTYFFTSFLVEFCLQTSFSQ